MDNIVKRPEFKATYDNYIGGKFVAPIGGQYFDVVSPIDGKVFTRAAHSTKVDIDLAVDKAHEAFQTWRNNIKILTTDWRNKFSSNIIIIRCLKFRSFYYIIHVVIYFILSKIVSYSSLE